MNNDFKEKNVGFIGHTNAIIQEKAFVEEDGGKCYDLWYYDESIPLDMIVLSDSYYKILKKKKKHYVLDKLLNLLNNENVRIFHELRFAEHFGLTIRKNEVQISSTLHKNMLASDYTVIDLETTGLNVNDSEIIEIAAVRVRNGEISETFDSLIRPCVKIPPYIESITGITNEMVCNEPLCDEVIEAFSDFVGDDIVVGHNIISFDSRILSIYYNDILEKSFDNEMIDTLKFSRKCTISPNDYKLTTLADYFGITYDAHRALNDCITNHQVYERLKPFFDENIAERHTTNRSVHHKQQRSEKTIALATLSALCKDLTNGLTLTDTQILDLHQWMKDNLHLSGNYPFDTIFEKLEVISKGGEITQESREALLSLLQTHTDPVKNKSEDCNDDFTGKIVCLTGEFRFGSRDAVTEVLKNRGVTVSSSVTSKTDYLIVGGEGSTAWACGNYGSKVKKALELQDKGKTIKIIREEVFVKWLNTTS